MNDKIYLNNPTEDNPIAIDLPTLLDTRLLVQANSGGGKSWLLRRILEESHGKTQQIVIDLEGEFSTLREKYDYIVAGKDGDTPISSQSAELLARKLLELNVSAILDLYELNHNDRKHFVRLFLESMINAPKELWHPCIVVIDEAHIFCPEKDKSEASEAVIDLATRGRKRGYCVILATQRLSKLHKDAAAECNNKLIGRTVIDIDTKRASEELGFTSKAQQLSLRDLKSGEFFAFGPAISREVIQVTIGDVKTSHPKAGSRNLTSRPTPPTEKIKRILAELKDLPQEAQEEAKTVEDLRRQVSNLKRELSLSKGRSEPLRVAPTSDQINKAVNDALQKQKTGYERNMKYLEAYSKKLRSALKDIGSIIASTLNEPEYEITVKEPEVKVKPDITPSTTQQEDLSIKDEVNDLPKGVMRLLKVLASRFPLTLIRTQLGTLVRPKNNAELYSGLSALRSREYITIDNSRIALTPRGLQAFGIAPDQIKTGKQTISLWQETLPGKARDIFDMLVSEYPHAFTRQDIAKIVGLSPRSGTFSKYLSMLRNNELLEVVGSKIKASENLFITEDGKNAA